MRLIRTLMLCLLPSLAAAQQPPSAQLLHTFVPSPANPISGLVQVPDGSFYGLTKTGIIRVSNSGDVTQVARFRDGTPSGSLVRASDGALYGTTIDGGPRDRGTIFRFDPSTEILRVVHGFASPTEGTNPVGGLVQVGGSLYGVTRHGSQGGGLGTVFHVVVATGTVVTDASFPDTFGRNPSEQLYTPAGPPTPGAHGRLYGVTAGGGFRIALYAFDPGTRVITPAHVLESTYGESDATAPTSALTLGPDGSLYGSAPSGGFDRAGTIYRYTPATDRFDLLYRLSPSNGQDGRSPGPLLAASDGHFYGVTSRRSDESPGGTLFRFRVGAGGTFTYEPLTQLDPLAAGAPASATLTQGADGLICGYASGGGPNSTGTLFRFDPAGGGPPSNPVAFTVRHTFPFVSTWGPSAPVLAPDGLLYGMTSFGGTTNRGAVYRVTPATGAVALLGAVPGSGIATVAVNSSLVAGPDGRLYGESVEITSSGAITRILRVEPGSGVVTIAVDGVGALDPQPLGISATTIGGLIRSASGQLFGTRLERAAGRYRIYRFDPLANTITDVAALPAMGGKSNLVPLANGDVVAAATLPNDGGFTTTWRSVLIRLNPAMPSGYEERPLSPPTFVGSVVLGVDGHLYGRADEPPNSVVRRISPATATTTALCGDAFWPTPAALSVGGDGALYGFVGSAVQRWLYRCNPVGGSLTVGAALPATIGPVPGSMARVGNLFYGASLENQAFLLDQRPAGSLFQLATPGTVLPSIDTDGDALPNGWETAFGLDPFDASRGSGAADDPDGDGRTNAQELADGTHPRGFVTRLFAEGASNGFFRTRFDIANPYDGPGAIVRARFQTDAGATVAADVIVAPWGHLGIDPSTLPGMPQGSFSAVFESDTPIAVDRSMSWDATGYGSHLETGIATPSTHWYFAEGSTSGDFSLFYLLQNPQTTAVTATVRYLRPFGLPPIDRTYMLPPTSRTTIVVDTTAAELASTDVSATITATAPIVAERAMYVNRPGQAFAAGHESAGVTAPALDWFLAEGATGAFFDLFVLIANPSTTAATVSVEYLRSSGPPLTKTYVVPAQSRITIWVDDEQLPAGSGQKPLAEGSVSTSVHVTNGVPVIVERAMWWPGPPITTNFWYEAHNSPGATGVATRWLIGGGEVGGADASDTYVLIANTADRAGVAKLWILHDGPYTSSAGAEDIALPPKSRTTVNLGSRRWLSGWYGVLVESSGSDPVPIVVERATYASPGGVFWGRGGNALATPLP